MNCFKKISFFIDVISRELLRESIYSANGQDGFLLNMSKKLTNDFEPFVVEFGAHGHFQGLMGLATAIDFNGVMLAIDSNPDYVAEINEIIQKHALTERLSVAEHFVEPEGCQTLDELLSRSRFANQEITLMIIDVDSFEVMDMNLAIFNSLRVRPAIIMLEIDPVFYEDFFNLKNVLAKKKI